jgi:molybdenum cofactor cytidylyltransferase
MKIGGLVLAAGASRRMGTSKALLEIQGETFLDRIVRLLRPVCDSLAVVVPPNGPMVADAVCNPDPDRGMLSSLRCGLDRLRDCDHVLFTPMDLPLLDARTVRRIADAAPLAPVVIPRHGEDRGHPVAIDRTVALELLAAPDGMQPRDIIRRDDSRVLFLDVDDPGVARDVDRPEDYRNLLLSIPC